MRTKIVVKHLFSTGTSANPQLRALIVDSDSNSRQLLIEFLSKNPLVRAVGVCANGLEAMVAIREYKPDVLICEVETSGIDGFSLLETAGIKNRPAAIFISNLERFAARAFEVGVVDYLVKPIRQERFEKAIERAQDHVERIKNLYHLNPPARPAGQLAIKTGRSVNFVRCDELDWAEAEGKYVRLHMGKESLVLKMSITALEAELDPAQFVRIHRSTIVNIDRVRRVQPWNHRRTYQIILQDGTLLVLSRKSKLRELKIVSAV